VFITFDLYDTHSFEEVLKYIDEAQNYSRTPLPIYVIGFNQTISNKDGTEIKNQVSSFKRTNKYYNFDLYNSTDQTKYDFEKYIMNIIEHMINSKVHNISGHLINKETKKRTQGTLQADFLINEHIAVSTPVIFNNDKDQEYYESLFFQVFRNKMLLKTIFENVSWIHRVSNIKAFSFYNAPINHLLTNNNTVYFKYLKEKQMVQSGINNNNIIYYREIRKEEFTYLNTVYLLRNNQVDFQFFKFVYDKYPTFFTDELYNDKIKSEISLNKLYSPFENACIGGNIEIVKFILDKSPDKSKCLSLLSLEYAISFGNLPIVIFMFENNIFQTDQAKHISKLIKISKKFNRPTITKFLEHEYSKLDLFSKLKYKLTS